jgi:putative intracellular protease/amidase
MTIEEAAMSPKTVHVAVYDTLSDWEIGYVTAHLHGPEWHREPGQFRVRTVGLTKDPITTKGGLRIVPDLSLDELEPSDSAILVLPGADTWIDGSGSTAPFAAAARRFVEAGVPVAAICGATVGLASVGLLDDRQHTSNAAMFLAGTGYQGAHLYRDELAVTDRDVITASATAPVEFAREILARLDAYRPETLASWYKLYGQQDAAGFFELMAAS